MTWGFYHGLFFEVLLLGSLGSFLNVGFGFAMAGYFSQFVIDSQLFTPAKTCRYYKMLGYLVHPWSWNSITRIQIVKRL
jgi:hypothetical protein